jgi:hypothetical protein
MRECIHTCDENSKGDEELVRPRECTSNLTRRGFSLVHWYGGGECSNAESGDEATDCGVCTRLADRRRGCLGKIDDAIHTSELVPSGEGAQLDDNTDAEDDTFDGHGATAAEPVSSSRA